MDVGTTTTQTEDVPPIGFNLPEEFQERVRINEAASLYPPLNTSTAGNYEWLFTHFYKNIFISQSETLVSS